MNIIAKIINLVAFNVMGTSITAWLISLINSYTLPLALLTGTSLLVINIMKIRGMMIEQRIRKIDEKIKLKKLENE